MTDAPPTRPYRVTFVNLLNGTRYEATIQAPTEFLARKGGDQAFSEHLAHTAGHRHDWTHYSTAEILMT